MSQRVADTEWSDLIWGVVIMGMVLAIVWFAIWGYPMMNDTGLTTWDHVYDRCMERYVYSARTHDLCTAYADASQ